MLSATACQAQPDGVRSGSDQCRAGRLETVEPGRLTLATGAVTRAPWVLGGDVAAGRSGDPRTGEGYDAAVGFALADRLGYDRDAVTWVGRGFADALAEGDKDFDVDVNQVTIREDRRATVDLSTPYYVVRPAVVTLAGRPVAEARTLDHLAAFALAVEQGTPAEAALRDALPDGAEVVVRPDEAEVRRAVTTGVAQALVTDYLSALRLDGDDTLLVDGTVVGVLPVVPEGAEEFGLVLEKDSPLTACVDAALAAMRDDGTLQQLERRWLVEEPGWRWFER